jgi:hypothetical protein
MYFSYVEIEYIATNFSPARTDLALKLLNLQKKLQFLRRFKVLFVVLFVVLEIVPKIVPK